MSDDKTEKPTPKRKRDLRRKGQVARSQELPQAVVLGVVVLLLPSTLGRLSTSLSNDWQQTLGLASSATPFSASKAFAQMLMHSAWAIAPIVGALTFTSLLSQFVMVGPRPNMVMVKPKFERVSPKAGIKRMISKQVIWELIKTLMKLGAVSLVTYGVWQAGVARLLHTPSTLQGAIDQTTGTVRGLLFRVAILSLLIGVTDAVVAKRRHLKASRMTKQEVKDEYKQSEGSPMAKQAMRSRAAKLSRTRMIAAVAKADVVLANPTHFAVALAYEKGNAAPVVLAKGSDLMAKRIREEAAKHNVPVIENKPLARALFAAVEVGDAIPAAFYRAVAEVLALVYRTKRQRRAA